MKASFEGTQKQNSVEFLNKNNIMTLKSLYAAAMTLLLLTGCKSGYNLKFNKGRCPECGTPVYSYQRSL